jgi:hypothetical protein
MARLLPFIEAPIDKACTLLDTLNCIMICTLAGLHWELTACMNLPPAVQVDRDFKEAEAALDSRTISKLQSQMLEALFEIYFRVLKQCTASPLLQQDPQTQQTQQQQTLQTQQQQTLQTQQQQAQAQQQATANGVSSQQAKRKGKGKGGAAYVLDA